LKISGEKENEQTIMHQKTKNIREAEVGRLKSIKETQQMKRVVQAKQTDKTVRIGRNSTFGTENLGIGGIILFHIVLILCTWKRMLLRASSELC
jgi:hypothetical protein